MRKRRRTPIDSPDEEDTVAQREAEDDQLAEAPEPEEATGERLPSETEDAEAAERADVEALQADLAEAHEDHLRALADLENFRRRARQEKRDAIRYGKETVLDSILSVVDNFDRALAAVGENTDYDALVQGVELIHKQLHDVLDRHGVCAIEAVGRPFDPHLHEAVGRIETDQHPEGTIVEEVLKGYMVGDTVLRHSRVMVAGPPAEPEDQDTGG